ncbi:MAG: acyltransferase [Planctomycetaceae bacterium]|nr:acyltransferase [Planctomycetaceae bacterium]
MNAVGVDHTRTDADVMTEAENLPATTLVDDSSGVMPAVAAPSFAPPRVLIKPERSDSPPKVLMRRFAFLDGLRALSAQAIVWHHIAFYGPLSDIAYPLIPTVIDVLAEYGRMAVQIFLVIGGFIAAQGLSRAVPKSGAELTRQIAKRYWRLAWPYFAILMIAVLANGVASQWMTHDSIAATPTVPQLIAHVFFLQTLLGYESLSSGLWYLAIDLQLSLMTLILCSAVGVVARSCGRKESTHRWSFVVFFPIAAAALFSWNRDPDHDIWAGYYFGSYFLGIATAWVLSDQIPRAWYIAAVALAAAALAYDFRIRLAIALVTCLVITFAGITGGLERWLRSPVMDYLARTSYSLFLIHFPICLVINAILSEPAANRPQLALAGMVLAWFVSCLAAIGFYHGVEKASLCRVAAIHRLAARPVS